MTSFREEKVKGVWWRHDAPDRQLQGEIMYGPASGASVELFGHLYPEFNEKRLNERFTLHGVTFRGMKITLFDAFIAHSQLSVPGSSWCTVESSFGVVGEHYDRPSNVIFKKLSIRFDGLRDWTWTSGIDSKHEWE